MLRMDEEAVKAGIAWLLAGRPWSGVLVDRCLRDEAWGRHTGVESVVRLQAVNNARSFFPC
jgi:hypothetical protein